MLNCNNQLAVMQTQLEKTQSRAMYWDAKWTRIQDTESRKTLKLGRLKMTTHNLYNLVNRHLQRSGVVSSVMEDENIIHQLQKIKMFIIDLTQVTEEIKGSTEQ